MDATHFIIWVFTIILLAWIFMYTFGVNIPFVGCGFEGDDTSHCGSGPWTGCPYKTA